MCPMTSYNYSTFDLEREEPVFHAFPRTFGVGERAPDGTLEDLASGDPTSLRSLAAGGVAILEFGSFT